MDTNNNYPENPDQGAEPESGQPVTMAAVLGLAREIEAVRERVEPVAGLTEQMEGLSDSVAELADMVTKLADTVAAQQHQPAAMSGAVSWLDLPDGADGGEPIEPDSVRRLLGELAVWVERVYLRYADAVRGFPECWLWHPDVLEELTWLHHAWSCAYLAEDARPALAWDWHDRYRPGVVRRINTLAGRCSLDNHTERGHAQHGDGSAPTAVGLGGLDAVADWWATGRHAAPPPPSDEVLAQARQAEADRLKDVGHR